jgi:hypothetical protein
MAISLVSMRVILSRLAGRQAADFSRRCRARRRSETKLHIGAAAELQMVSD